jgi:hypothetical protein
MKARRLSQDADSLYSRGTRILPSGVNKPLRSGKTSQF